MWVSGRYLLKMNKVYLPLGRKQLTVLVAQRSPNGAVLTQQVTSGKVCTHFSVLTTGMCGGMLLVRGQGYWLISYVYKQPLMTSCLAQNNNSVEAKKSCGSW